MNKGLNNERTNGKKYTLLFFSLIGFFSAILFIYKSIGVEGYSLLFLLPLSFSVLLLCTQKCWCEIPNNFGMTFLYIIELVRLVISPFLVIISDYHQVINTGTPMNNTYGILLLVYETLAITFSLNVKVKSKYYEYESIDNVSSNHRMSNAIFLICLFSIGICAICPSLLKNYRTIVGLFSDVKFTAFEGSSSIDQYSTGFVQKLLLVTGTYLFKVVRLLVPAYILVVIRNKTHAIFNLLSYVVICSPLLFVDGTIARSIFYTIFLLLFYYKLYKKDIRKMYVPIVIGGVFVLVYFYVRFKVIGDSDLIIYFADKSIDYFAGANIIGGIFNLPSDFSYRIKYFLYDILRMIPYANTIFGLNSGDYIQTFFNIHCNTTGGQIPPTIGLGSYYFGIILAPLYSCLFAVLCKKYGRKAMYTENPYFRLVYIYISFITALGIGMYSIDVTLLTLSQVILPIYIISKLCYKPISCVSC